MEKPKTATNHPLIFLSCNRNIKTNCVFFEVIKTRTVNSGVGAFSKVTG